MINTIIVGSTQEGIPTNHQYNRSTFGLDDAEVGRSDEVRHRIYKKERKKTRS